jgi:hypothetical protein
LGIVAHLNFGNLLLVSDILWKAGELKAEVTAAQERKSMMTLAVILQILKYAIPFCC